MTTPLHSLFTLHQIQRQEEVCDFQIEINPEHPIFEGHLPGDAVLPGVIYLEIIKRAFDFKYNIQKIKSLKFLSPVRPKQITVLQCNLKLSPVLATQESPEGLEISGVFTQSLAKPIRDIQNIKNPLPNKEIPYCKLKLTLGQPLHQN